MPCIVGTAGHIDHGKTSLVKALTGQDTDRLAEEKARGISIELGFAHLDLDDGARIGVVDVPGHERFIRTMLAGAHGMDLVLFTVAADDGVMPQTVEHLDILHLLGVRRAIFVITKADLVDGARVAAVAREIGALARGTSLEGAPVTVCSLATGAGLDDLRREIGIALRRIEKPTPPGYFRLPVDRVFALRGHGLVVTGTALQGEVRPGDRVRCLPGDRLFRVRAVQVHGEHVPVATWGQRVALNLSGPDGPSIARGEVLCDERLTATTSRFDAAVEVRPSAPGGLRSHQRVRVHLGTAERMGRVIVLAAFPERPAGPGREESGGALAPGGAAFCQIALAEPLQALRGDRFVIRDETAQRTLGGGRVLHPSVEVHRHRDASLVETLRLLQTGKPGDVAAAFLEQRSGFASTIEPLHQFLNVRADAAAEYLRGTDTIAVLTVDGEDYYTTGRKWRALGEAIVAELRAFHAAQPLAPGREMEDVRQQLATAIPSKLFRVCVDRLERERAMIREGSLLRLPGHRVELGGAEQQAADRIRGLLAAAPLAPPDVPQLVRGTGLDRAALGALLRVLERSEDIVRVAPDLYFLKAALDGVKRLVRSEFADGTEITPAMFRDRLGITRKHAIPLLEFLDREAVTVRLGGVRRVRPARTSVL